MHLCRGRKLFGIILVALFLWIQAVTGTRAAAVKQVLIIDLPRLTFEDLPLFPNLTRFCNTAAVGIMAARISGVATPEKLYLNLNSGKQLWSVEDSRFILDESELYNELPAGKLYHSLTGIHPKPGNGVYLGLPKTIQLNLKNDPRPNIGIIGQTLHQAGVKTAAIGNADTAEWMNRSGSILLVDERGLIDLAAVGEETTVKEPGFPSGLRSNNPKILEFWRRFKDQARVISISLGDLERVERFRDWLTEARKAYFRKQALQDYDRLLGQLLKEVDRSQTMVVLYSVIAPEIEGRSQRLNPVVIAGPDLKPGLIISNSTRRKALLTGQDMIAAVFSHLGIEKHNYLAGRPITSVPGDWKTTGTMLRDLDLNYQVRWTLLPIHGYLLIALVVLAVLGLIFWPRNLKLFESLHQIYLFLLTVPAVFLVEAFINPVNWPEIAVWTLGLAGGLYFLVKILSRNDNRRALLLISLITVGLIAADGLQNGFLELRSFWGYSAVAAARFYGIGNEYMGFILGAYIVAVTLGLDWFGERKRWLLWVFWFAMAVFLFCPVLGANIGGGIAASIGLGMANFFWLGHSISKRKIAALFGALMVMLVLVGLTDFLIFGKQMSHFGQYLRLVTEQGFPAVFEMVIRKWQLNLTLMAYTGWSYVLVGLLVFVPLLYQNPPRPLRALMDRYPGIAKGMMGFISTCIVAFLVNDSGIVAAATMFIFGFDMLLVTIIEECRSKELT